MSEPAQERPGVIVRVDGAQRIVDGEQPVMVVEDENGDLWWSPVVNASFSPERGERRRSSRGSVRTATSSSCRPDWS